MGATAPATSLARTAGSDDRACTYVLYRARPTRRPPRVLGRGWLPSTPGAPPSVVLVVVVTEAEVAAEAEAPHVARNFRTAACIAAAASASFSAAEDGVVVASSGLGTVSRLPLEACNICCIGAGRFSSAKGRASCCTTPSSPVKKIMGLNQGFCTRADWCFKYLKALAWKPWVTAGVTSSTFFVTYLVSRCPSKVCRKRAATAGMMRFTKA
mmetsp:Transcript_86691/g.248740  ORF Transcript_86691/g.248740 Transcript_86691/m.248740 type:complete len:212 (+) Transcript_86691:71-706(+)